MRKALSVLLALAGIAGAAKGPAWERAKVVWQSIGSEAAGAYAAPIGTAVAAVPLYRTSSQVVVDSGGIRYTLLESSRSPVVFLVGGETGFYREGNWFVFWDAKKKKHKFSLLGMKALEPPK